MSGPDDYARERETIRARVETLTERCGDDNRDTHATLCIVAMLEELTRAICNVAETLDARLAGISEAVLDVNDDS